MPAFGGYHPFPRRCGGEWHRLETIHVSLMSQMGSSYPTTSSSISYARNMAIARMLSAAWGTNERMASTWTPSKMDSTLLDRWESILALRPRPGTTDVERRVAVSSLLSEHGTPATQGEIVGKLQALLGDFFVALETISIANAVVHVPSASYPWGTVADGAPWYSTVAHVLVRMTTPTGHTESDFYARAGSVFAELSGLLPAWVTVDWYRAPEVGTPVNVSGGPSAGGFYLDETNLDVLVFDV